MFCNKNKLTIGCDVTDTLFDLPCSVSATDDIKRVTSPSVGIVLSRLEIPA